MRVGIYEIDQFFFAVAQEQLPFPNHLCEAFVNVPEEVFARWEAAKNAHFSVMDEIKALYDAEMDKLAAAEEARSSCGRCCASYCECSANCDCGCNDDNACDICDKEDA